jgi:hypothetical protein
VVLMTRLNCLSELSGLGVLAQARVNPLREVELDQSLRLLGREGDLPNAPHVPRPIVQQGDDGPSWCAGRRAGGGWGSGGGG